MCSLGTEYVHQGTSTFTLLYVWYTLTFSANPAFKWSASAETEIHITEQCTQKRDFKYNFTLSHKNLKKQRGSEIWQLIGPWLVCIPKLKAASALKCTWRRKKDISRVPRNCKCADYNRHPVHQCFRINLDYWGVPSFFFYSAEPDRSWHPSPSTVTQGNTPSLFWQDTSKDVCGCYVNTIGMYFHLPSTFFK